MSRTYLFCFVLCLIQLLRANGQQLLVKKLPSFQISAMPLTAALDQLSAGAGLRISYQSDLMHGKQAPATAVTHKTVQEILQLLLADEFEYTESRDFIVIVPRHSYYIISGQIQDKETGAPLSGVQVATTNGLFSTTSSANGNYRLRIPFCYQVSYLTYKKELYQDAFISLATPSDQQYSIRLTPQAVQVLTPVFASGSTGNSDSSRVQLHILGKRNRANTIFQASGLFNHNLANASNFQFAGTVNLVEQSMKGFQMAGLFNRVRNTASGMQLAGLVNKTTGLVTGVQLATVNRAGKLKGLQIGLVNISDSSTGYSLGLLNIVRNRSGYHTISVYASDLMNMNLAVKLGNSRLYSVIMAGTNMVPHQRLHSLGFGMGHDHIFSSAVRLATEVNYQFIHAGSWDNRLFQCKMAADIAIAKKYRVFAGPVFNHYTNSQGYIVPGYKNPGPTEYKQSRDWIGWQAGITATDWLWWRAQKQAMVNPRWIMEAGVATGVSINSQPWWSVDVKAEKGVLGNSVTFMLAGFVNSRYTNSDSVANTHFYGLRTGLKIFALGKWFVAGELGYTLNEMHRETFRLGSSPDISEKRLLFVSPSVGWNTGRKTNISLRFESLESVFLLRFGWRLL